MHDKPFVISAYFNGTGHALEQPSWLINNVYSNTADDSSDSKKFGFSGCGIQYPVSGGLFGAGLDKQAAVVADEVIKQIANGRKVTLNLCGHSRGSLATLLLIKQLQLIDPNLLEINLVMMDPVPGSLLTTAMLDVLGIYLANKTMDLRDCPQLKNVLALYPHEPLPAFICHAPEFCLYPEHANVVEEVIPGCHSVTQNLLGGDTDINFYHVIQFLQKHGTLFSDGLVPSIKNVVIADYKRSLNKYNISNRVAHSLYGTIIKTKKEKKTYFNLDHQRLSGVKSDPTQVLVTIEKTNSILSSIKRCMTDHPFLAAQFKWGLIASIIAAKLVFSGTLAFPLLVVIPVVALFIHAVLYKTGLATKLVDKIAYPHFKVRNMPIFFKPEGKVGEAQSENNILSMERADCQNMGI